MLSIGTVKDVYLLPINFSNIPEKHHHMTSQFVNKEYHTVLPTP